MILHSKITKIHSKTFSNTPDHTRSSQQHAFGTYFLTGACQNSYPSLSPFPPQTEGTPHTSNGLSVDARVVPFSMGEFPRFGRKGDSEEKLFWRGLVGKYVPNSCSWELLVWSGLIWGRFGVHFSDFRMQNHSVLYTFCQICKRVLACKALHVLLHV